jgi:hypothetical protein
MILGSLGSRNINHLIPDTRDLIQKSYAIDI